MFAAALAVFGLAVLFTFDPRRYHFYPVCLFHQTTGWLCPGCGGLRAMHQLLHGHLALAFRFNPLLMLLLPFLGVFSAVWVGQHVQTYFRYREASDAKREGTSCPRPGKSFRLNWMLWLFLAAAIVFGIWRNVPGSPFALLPN